MIRSSSVDLTIKNFDELVIDGNDIWVIMVYVDSDETSRTYTGFFDEAAKRYPFVKYGRINYHTEQRLLSKLPFKVEEIPFFFNYDKYGNSEFLEFDMEREGKTPILKFIRSSIGKHHKVPGIGALEKAIQAEKASKPSVIYVSRSYMPTTFSYLAYKFSGLMDVLSTKFGESKLIYSLVDRDEVDYVIRLPDGLKYKDQNLVTIKYPRVEGKREATHLRIFTLVKFLVIPDVGRNRFNEFCRDITAGEGES